MPATEQLIEMANRIRALADGQPELGSAALKRARRIAAERSTAPSVSDEIRRLSVMLSVIHGA